uniref:Sporulation transcription factor Spo0A n=1 Tax=Myoviridae sp. ct4uh47 TaxID=2825032 RepID=A0A8S5V5N8_9CAUD|nr:MAG TPA: sporulation transcription factor Spo0A [Myoviridae sp. ct4uh47]
MNEKYYELLKQHKEYEAWIDSVFLELGIPQNVKGYDYLMAAVLIATDEPELIQAMTKELYPRVADLFNTTAFRVERSIRHAIELAWSNGETETLNRLFGYTVGVAKGKPTNSNFIAIMANKLRRAYY